MCAAVIALDWLVALPVVGVEPSPQSIVYDHGPSFTPASENVALNVKLVPALAVWAAAATAGVAFALVGGVGAGAAAGPPGSGGPHGRGVEPLVGARVVRRAPALRRPT